MVVELCWIDQRRSGDRVVGEQLAALVARRLQRLAIVEHGAAAIELGLGRVLAPALGELRQSQRVDRHRRDHAQRHHLA